MKGLSFPFLTSSNSRHPCHFKFGEFQRRFQTSEISPVGAFYAVFIGQENCNKSWKQGRKQKIKQANSTYLVLLKFIWMTMSCDGGGCQSCCSRRISPSIAIYERTSPRYCAYAGVREQAGLLMQHSAKYPHGFLHAGRSR